MKTIAQRMIESQQFDKSVFEKIDKLRQLEDKARKLQNSLDNTSRKWENIYNEVRDTPEFIQFSKNNGTAVNYNFGDIIA